MSIISCVALFCKAGKGGKDFSRKEKFRVECPKNEDGTEIKLKDLKELICQFGGICTVARDVGLGEELDLRIGRLDSRCDRYSMNTDAQVRLEMPRIREGIDKLQVLVYPVELIFSPKKAHIVIEVSGEYNSSQVKKQTPSTAKRSKSLSDKEKRELEEELKKLKESKLIEDQSVMARTRTGARVHWPWRIECGQCHVGLLLRYDANTSGRIRRFRNGHYDNCVKSPRTNATSIINSFANHGKSRKRHAADTSAIVQLEIDRDSDVERSDEEEKM